MKIRKASYVILLSLFYFVIQTGTSLAYELYYPGIQHRVADYEASNIGDRLAFEVRDDSLNYVYSESAVTGVVLKSPDGSMVTLGDLLYEEFIYYRSSFNPDNSEYSYKSPILWSGFSTDIESPLVIGAYTIEVTIVPETSCPESKSPIVTTVTATDATTPSGWARINGTVEYDGSPLCAMVLANGHYMFSCGENNGKYDLTMPLDGNGQITQYVFVSGFQPYKQTFTP
jgi:hypothetical protein